MIHLFDILGKRRAALNARSIMHIQTEELLIVNNDSMEGPVEEDVGGQQDKVDVD